LDVEEQSVVVPGEFANYLWAVGQGGPNSGKVAVEDVTAGTYGRNTVGIYMKKVDRSEIKQTGVSSPTPTHLHAIVDAEAAKSKIPRDSYTVDISPAVEPYYSVDYFLGDVIRLDADKGALVVTNKKLRIYEVDLNNSDNNMEKATVTLADDFYGKVATTT
jgi:hypothetical protein